MKNADEAKRYIVERVIHSHSIGCLNEANIIQNLIGNEGRFACFLLVEIFSPIFKSILEADAAASPDLSYRFTSPAIGINSRPVLWLTLNH